MCRAVGNLSRPVTPATSPRNLKFKFEVVNHVSSRRQLENQLPFGDQLVFVGVGSNLGIGDNPQTLS